MDQEIRLENGLIMPHTEETSNSPSSHSGGSKWHFWGHKLPKSEIVFFVQIIIVYIVVIVSIANLTYGRSNDKVWIAFLSSSLGYILPNPKLNKNV